MKGYYLIKHHCSVRKRSKILILFKINRKSGARLFLAGLVLCLLLGQQPLTRADGIALPEMGDSSDSALSPAQARKIGERLMRRMQRVLYINTDPLVQDYIQSLGYRLASFSDNKTLQFTFFVVNDKGVNAFAAPGGFIGINTGLILTSQSEDELAAVLAHEIAHITQKHLARSVEAASKHRLATMLIILAAVLVGSQSSELTEAAIATGIATSAQLRINFTRANEQEADRIGIMLLHRAGFNPNSMATFFERMQQSLRLYGSRPPEFLSTHPVTSNRIGEARSRSRDLQPGKNERDRLDYFLIRARLRVLSSNEPHKLEKQIRLNLENGSYLDKTAERYALALSLLVNDKPQQALPLATRLYRQHPDRIIMILLQADALHKAGKTGKAERVYKLALENYPNNRAIVSATAGLMLKTGKAAQAKKLLAAYMRNKKADAGIYRLAANAASQLKQPDESMLFLAEHYFALGRVSDAIQQLQRANKLPNLDYFMSSRIQARLLEMKKIASEENAK